MRTKLAPGCADSQASTVPICGTSAIAGVLEVVAALPPVVERPAVLAVPAREDLGGRQAARAGSRAAPASRRAPAAQRRQPIARPFARDRQAQQAGGTSLPSVGATASACFGSIRHNDGQQPQRRRGVRRTAADARCDRQSLVERQGRALRRPPPRSASARAALSTRLSSFAESSAANGPRHVTATDSSGWLSRSAGRRRCRRRRSSRSHAARRAACLARAARG